MSFHFRANLALGLENKISVPPVWHKSIRQLKAGSEEEITNEMSGEYKVKNLSFKKEESWDNNSAPTRH